MSTTFWSDAPGVDVLLSTTKKWTSPPGITVPRAHVTWPGATTGATPSVAVTNEVPAGRVSVSTTFAAGALPWFR